MRGPFSTPITPLPGSLFHADPHSRGIYNKAEYEHQRRHMMQEWSNLVDAWVAGQKYTPTLYPPTMDLLTPEPDV